MTLRARLEELKKMGWTIDDLIELTSELEEAAGFKNDEKKTVTVKQDFIDDIKSHNLDMGVYQEISKILLLFGITPNLKGYHYIMEAVQLGMKDKDVFTMLTSHLYYPVAKKYNTTPQKVERCVRHAIEKGWKKTSEENKLAILSTTYQFVPNTSEFVGLLCEKAVCSLANKGTINI